MLLFLLRRTSSQLWLWPSSGRKRSATSRLRFRLPCRIGSKKRRRENEFCKECRSSTPHPSIPISRVYLGFFVVGFEGEVEKGARNSSVLASVVHVGVAVEKKLVAFSQRFTTKIFIPFGGSVQVPRRLFRFFDMKPHAVSS